MSGKALFFASLVILTAATGLLAPRCAVVELILRKKNMGVYLMVIFLGLVFAWGRGAKGVATQGWIEKVRG